MSKRRKEVCGCKRDERVLAVCQKGERNCVTRKEKRKEWKCVAVKETREGWQCVKKTKGSLWQ